jgi:hypothetical protein
MFHFKCNLTTTHETLHALNDETNGNIEFLQPYPVVAADALLEIGTAAITAVLSLHEHLSKANTSCDQNFCYQSAHYRVIRHFLVKIRIAKCFMSRSKRFRCEVIFETEHSSARQYTMTASAQLWRSWREQRPGKQGDLDSSVTG